MPRRVRIASVLAVAIVMMAGAAELSAKGEVREKHGGVVVDWTEGVMTAKGAAAGDLRAPSASVARVGAERRAREAARERLAAAARELSLAAGSTVGAKLESDPAAAARFDAALARTRARSVRYSTDGSVMLEEVLPLEAVRLAVSGPRRPPAAEGDAPTAVIVDARSVKGLKPALGLALGSGKARYGGPTVFHGTRARAGRDLRLGKNVVRLEAVTTADGVLEIGDGADKGAADTVAELREAGALVVIVLPGKR